jgi:glutathione peroxidase
VSTLARRLVAAAVLAVPAGAALACAPLLNHSFPGLHDERAQSLCAYQGKVVVVVNTASQCGYTPQYEVLQSLYKSYKDRGLVVLGFPANDFGGQEPGSNKEIAEFCQVNYGVSFPMFAKTSVVGRTANPLFADLARQTGAAPQWNFHKYLIDRGGNRVMSFDSKVRPDSREFVAAVESLLEAR